MIKRIWQWLAVVVVAGLVLGSRFGPDWLDIPLLLIGLGSGLALFYRLEASRKAESVTPAHHLESAAAEVMAVQQMLGNDHPMHHRLGRMHDDIQQARRHVKPGIEWQRRHNYDDVRKGTV